MKLATLKDETRDGCLTVVSRNLKFAIKADDIDGLIGFAQREKIDFVVVGPEAPLVARSRIRLRRVSWERAAKPAAASDDSIVLE